MDFLVDPHLWIAFAMLTQVLALASEAPNTLARGRCSALVGI